MRKPLLVLAVLAVCAVLIVALSHYIESFLSPFL